MLVGGCQRGGRPTGAGTGLPKRGARPRDKRELLRPDSPAAAPPVFALNGVDGYTGGAAVAPKRKEKSIGGSALAAVAIDGDAGVELKTHQQYQGVELYP